MQITIQQTMFVTNRSRDVTRVSSMLLQQQLLLSIRSFSGVVWWSVGLTVVVTFVRRRIILIKTLYCHALSPQWPAGMQAHALSSILLASNSG